MFRRLKNRRNFIQNMQVMASGENSPYIAAIQESASARYEAPDDADDPKGHIQNGSMVQLKNGTIYAVTDSGAIHVSGGKFGWMKTQKLLDKADNGEVQAVMARSGLFGRLKRKWGNPTKLPSEAEDQ